MPIAAAVRSRTKQFESDAIWQTLRPTAVWLAAARIRMHTLRGAMCPEQFGYPVLPYKYPWKGIVTGRRRQSAVLRGECTEGECPIPLGLEASAIRGTRPGSGLGCSHIQAVVDPVQQQFDLGFAFGRIDQVDRSLLVQRRCRPMQPAKCVRLIAKYARGQLDDALRCWLV